MKRFGTPKAIASDYISEMEVEMLVEHLNKTQMTFRIMIISAVIALTMLGSCIVLSYIDHVKDTNGYMVVEIIEVERTFEEVQ